MNGKTILYKTMRHQKQSRILWVPFAGVHAGKLTGYTAKEVLTERTKLLESLLAVNKLYDPDGQPVVFDLQIEAEILGCDLIWADDVPPSVASHPLANALKVPSYLPDPTDGRLPVILDVMREMKKAVGEHTALYGLVCGPLTLASHLRGTEIFMDMYYNVNFVKDLFSYAKDVTLRIAAHYIDAGMDVIGVVDPMTSQISPKHFQAFLSQHYTFIFDEIRKKERFSSFFVCGDTTKNIEVMCQTGPDCLSVDENVDLSEAKRITDKYNIVIGGNIPLTTTMLLGTQQDNIKFVLDLLEKIDHKNFILSPGCDMPYNVPPENVIGILKAVRDPEGSKKIIENYKIPHLEIDVELIDYKSLMKPIVEVFTLDSELCAACKYMWAAAQRSVAEKHGAVDLVEHKFTEASSIVRAKKMGVNSLPAIYINGELKFSSIIPNNKELIAAIEEYL